MKSPDVPALIAIVVLTLKVKLAVQWVVVYLLSNVPY